MIDAVDAMLELATLSDKLLVRNVGYDYEYDATAASTVCPCDRA